MSETDSSQGFLSSLPILDALRSDPDTIWQRTEGSNLDELIQGSSGDTTPDLMGTQAVCHLVAFMPFTVGDGQPRQAQFEEAAAIALAAHHLNVGDGSIVPEVGGLSERCGIRFTVEFSDTEYDAGASLNHVVEVMSREPGVEKQPCAFIGAYRSALSIPTSILTGLRRFPQISGGSTSADLDDKSQYPLFGRTIPSDHGNAVPIIKFMREVLGIKHLAVININDAYGNAFVEGLRMAAEQYAPDMNIHQSPVDDDMPSIYSALQSVKATKYRYIFAIVFTEKTHDALMEEAYRMGIAGNGQHQWLFGDSFEGLENRKFPVNSPLHLAYRGVAVLEATGGTPGLDGFDNFAQHLSTLNNPVDLDYLFKILPSQFDASILDDNFVDFLDPLTGSQATFVYEAAIALGLAACKTVGKSSDSSQIFLDGQEHYRTTIESTFQGVNDLVAFDPETGSKDPIYTLYTVENFVDLPETDDGNIEFKASFSHIYEGGSWQQLEPFIFNDGSSTIPVDIPPPSAVDNTISLAVRGTMLAMCAVILAMAGACIWWTNRHRKARVILASQPFFLHIICIGVFVLGSTIIPLSIDSGVVDINGCSKACTAVPWLGSLGFSITICALFTKTHRVNIILNSSVQMKRIKVTIWDVAKPMLALISVSVVILSCMTAFAPPFYELVVKNVDAFGRSIDVRGQCNYNKALPYFSVVIAMIAGALTLAIVQAFKARNLSTEFAESLSIFRSLVAMILVVFVGGPVLLLAKDNPNVYAFVASAIIFVSCMSILVLIFAPKLKHLKTQKKADQRKKKGSRVRVTGIGPSIGRMSMSISMRSEALVEEFEGMKILTTKTPEELLQEVEELKFLLVEAAQNTKSESSFNKKVGKRASRFLSGRGSGSRHSRLSLGSASVDGDSNEFASAEPSKDDDEVVPKSTNDDSGQLPQTIVLVDEHSESMEEEVVPLNDVFVENIRGKDNSPRSSEAESIESVQKLEAMREKRDAAMEKLKSLRGVISETSSGSSSKQN